MSGPDRHVRQAGLDGTRVTGAYPSFSQVSQTEGVVVAVCYTDDSRNRSKKYVEYDVRDLKNGQLYSNCRCLSSGSGQDDGSEDVLRPAQKLQDNASGGSFVFDPASAPLSSSDGDRVVLAFTHGAHHSPVILGTVQHRRTAFGASRLDGRRRYTTHQGTSVETKADGTYRILRNINGVPSQITVYPGGEVYIDSDNSVIAIHDGMVEITHSTGASAVLQADGRVTVVPAVGRTIDLGQEDGLVPLLQGVVTGESRDSFTGAPHSLASGASVVVLAKLTP